MIHLELTRLSLFFVVFRVFNRLLNWSKLKKHDFFSFQAEDFLDEILSLNDGIKLDSSSDIKIKQEPSIMEAEARDRQKKDNHNMSKFACRACSFVI